MNTWKTCKESLPEPGENVLVACDHGLVIARREWEQGWNPEHWRDTHEHRIEMKEVTHWMPLPALPNGS